MYKLLKPMLVKTIRRRRMLRLLARYVRISIQVLYCRSYIRHRELYGAQLTVERKIQYKFDTIKVREQFHPVRTITLSWTSLKFRLTLRLVKNKKLAVLLS